VTCQKSFVTADELEGMRGLSAREIMARLNVSMWQLRATLSLCNAGSWADASVQLDRGDEAAACCGEIVQPKASTHSLVPIPVMPATASA
jgi:hypothetical protein